MEVTHFHLRHFMNELSDEIRHMITLFIDENTQRSDTAVLDSAHCAGGRPKYL